MEGLGLGPRILLSVAVEKEIKHGGIYPQNDLFVAWSLVKARRKDKNLFSKVVDQMLDDDILKN